MDRCGLNPGKISLKSRVCVICLAVAATLTSLLVQPLIALAATPSSCVLKWGTVDTPGGFPQRNDIRYGSEINAL
ncbi:MAG: hypothetical protein NT177_03130, partial [Chloroflexi bacterium]|nr:hypothetical protein [Chloroflexota bacterium]